MSKLGICYLVLNLAPHIAYVKFESKYIGEWFSYSDSKFGIALEML